MDQSLSRLSELLRQARKADPQLGKDLEAEVAALMKRRTFGLVFEQHQPEAVELPGRAVRRGDKVRMLPPRGEVKQGDQRLWRVEQIEHVAGGRVAHLLELDAEEPQEQAAPVEDLVVVAEFNDRIYPGLLETGRVERGGDKPFHTVINAENFHALEMLTYTHRGKVDAIYIDPPYNTGAKDWKYNNNYVEGDDDYRHSKWLAFMQRRLEVARDLLNPEDSVLIVAIDEKEYARLGLLLEQTFPEGQIQMVSAVINPSGAKRDALFSRSDEYLYFVTFGQAHVEHPKGDGVEREVRWWYLRRTDVTSRRGTKKGGRAQFYPIYVDDRTQRIAHIGAPLEPSDSLDAAPDLPGMTKVFPIREDGLHMNWGLTGPSLQSLLDRGLVRTTRGHENQPYIFTYISARSLPKISSGEWEVRGEREDGSKIVVMTEGKVTRATTTWRNTAHDAGQYGTSTLGALIGLRRFPFPKSLYAVEDALRFFVKTKPDATILDFFSGSGTTAHAVMRLNRQDGGRRQCISVTNNEVSAEEQRRLRKEGLRPGDADWEAQGICDYITKPRVTAAVTGRTPEGEPIKGDYKFVDEFPMSDGFEENVAFFTLTYEAPLSVRHNRAFERIAPMLWMRAGSQGRIITDLGENGWDTAETYGVLENLDQAGDFVARVAEEDPVRTAFIVTDDDSAFQMVCRDLPSRVLPVRMYESYLQNFMLRGGR